MNYLALCQETARECGIAGTGPSAVTGQVGRLADIVRFVNRANMKILQRHNEWRFMVGHFSVNTTASDGAYAWGDCTDVATAVAIANFRNWRLDTLKIYLTSAGVGTEAELTFIDYMEWYRRYNRGTQNDGYPLDFTVDHDEDLLLAPKPNGIYTMTGEYQKSAVDLAANDDIPLFPVEYHPAIVYRSMMMYGRYAGAPEVYADGQSEFLRMMGEMERTQLPPVDFGGPLT